MLAQCDRCSVKSTANVNGNGRIVSVLVPSSPLRDGTWEHAVCGGRLVGFDIEVAE